MTSNGVDGGASDDGSDGDALDGGVEDGLPADAGVPMRFVVISRDAGRVHLVSEGGGAMFAHPSVCDEVWQAALDDVPDEWEIVDLAPASEDAVSAEPVGADDPDEGVGGPDWLAQHLFELLVSFVDAGFDRAEAMSLVLEVVRQGEGLDG